MAANFTTEPCAPSCATCSTAEIVSLALVGLLDSDDDDGTVGACFNNRVSKNMDLDLENYTSGNLYLLEIALESSDDDDDEESGAYFNSFPRTAPSSEIAAEEDFHLESEDDDDGIGACFVPKLASQRYTSEKLFLRGLALESEGDGRTVDWSTAFNSFPLASRSFVTSEDHLLELASSCSEDDGSDPCFDSFPKRASLSFEVVCPLELPLECKDGDTSFYDMSGADSFLTDYLVNYQEELDQVEFDDDDHHPPTAPAFPEGTKHPASPEHAAMMMTQPSAPPEQTVAPASPEQTVAPASPVRTAVAPASPVRTVVVPASPIRTVVVPACPERTAVAPASPERTAVVPACPEAARLPGGITYTPEEFFRLFPRRSTPLTVCQHTSGGSDGVNTAMGRWHVSQCSECAITTATSMTCSAGRRDAQQQTSPEERSAPRGRGHAGRSPPRARSRSPPHARAARSRSRSPQTNSTGATADDTSSLELFNTFFSHIIAQMKGVAQRAKQHADVAYCRTTTYTPEEFFDLFRRNEARWSEEQSPPCAVAERRHSWKSIRKLNKVTWPRRAR